MALRGRVDVYEHPYSGWVGRSWPRKSSQPRTEGEVASSLRFITYTKATGMVSDVVRQGWKEHMGGAIGVTWVDAFRATAAGNPWVENPNGG